MFRLNRPDIFPVGDLGIVKGMQKLFGMKRRPSRRTMERLAGRGVRIDRSPRGTSGASEAVSSRRALPHCQAAMPDSSRFCPSCGRAIAGDAKTAAATDDVATRLSGGGISNAATRMAPGSEAATRMASSASRPPTASSGGWLTSSGSIDHGRFAPGHDSRRPLSDHRPARARRHGRGLSRRRSAARPAGRAEVPAATTSCAIRRGSRSFTTKSGPRARSRIPNVCRVYDIGEVGGPALPVDGVRRRRGPRRRCCAASAGCPKTRRWRSRGSSAPGSRPRTSAACCTAT